MKRTATLLTMALAVAACSSSGQANDGTEVTTTTVAETTTTTEAPAPADLCTDLKVASFDLDSAYSAMFESAADLEELDTLSDSEAATMLLSPLVSFYAAVGDLAAAAPAEIASDFETVGSAADAIETLASDPETAASSDLDFSAAVGDEITAAATNVEEWTRDNCDTEVVIEPEQLITTTVMSAMFGAMGEAFGDLGDELGNLSDDGTLGDGSFSSGTYGDDPELDALWDGCEAGDGASCSELYWSTFGVYELYAQTCGGRISLRPGYTVDCESMLSEGGPQAVGDDAYLDSLAESCQSGDAATCDQLFGSAPAGSDYETIGASCGGARSGATIRPCDWSEGDPFTFGDDDAFDQLWNECAAGDSGSCSDLWFEAPIDSVYEAFGDTCGTLIDRGEADCSSILEILAPSLGPTG